MGGGSQFFLFGLKNPDKQVIEIRACKCLKKIVCSSRQHHWSCIAAHDILPYITELINTLLPACWNTMMPISNSVIMVKILLVSCLIIAIPIPVYFM